MKIEKSFVLNTCASLVLAGGILFGLYWLVSTTYYNKQDNITIINWINGVQASAQKAQQAPTQ